MGMSAEGDADVEACAAATRVDAKGPAERVDALGEHDGTNAQAAAIRVAVLAMEGESVAVVRHGEVQLLVLLADVDRHRGGVGVLGGIDDRLAHDLPDLSLIHISEPTRLLSISYAV